MRVAFLIVCVLCGCFTVSAQNLIEQKTLELHGTLKGEMVVLAGKQKFDLVVIQAGSGPTDRYGNNPLGVKAASYRMLADSFAAAGIGTLLIDKRAIAASAGAATSEKDLLFSTYADDLAAWIKLASLDARVRKIFIAGHSEGSLVGMIAAQETNVAGYISLEGAGRRIDKVIFDQVNAQSPAIALQLDSMFTRLRNGQILDSVPKQFMMLLRPSIQPYMTSWMKFDPCIEIAKLKIPVLIVQGTTDLQTGIEEGNSLHACAPKASFLLVPGMNHILKAAPETRAENFATYSNASLPLIPGLASALIRFIKEND